MVLLRAAAAVDTPRKFSHLHVVARARIPAVKFSKAILINGTGGLAGGSALTRLTRAWTFTSDYYFYARGASRGLKSLRDYPCSLPLAVPILSESASRFGFVGFLIARGHTRG